MAVKIGNNDITLKLGSADVSAAYIGDTLVYSGGTQPQTLQWVTFSNGDTIPSDLQIYGIKGTVNDLSDAFVGFEDDIYVEDESHNMYGVHIGGYYGGCYEESGIASNTSVEYIFSNIGCSDSYTVSSHTIAYMSNDIQLYIYA